MINKEQKSRNVGETVSNLLAHIDWKLSILPEAVKSWGLGEEALNSLSSNLQRERENY